MSQYAVPRACHKPVRFGLPSVIRGMRGAPAAGVWPLSGTTMKKMASTAVAAINQTLNRSDILPGLLKFDSFYSAASIGPDANEKRRQCQTERRKVQHALGHRNQIARVSIQLPILHANRNAHRRSRLTCFCRETLSLRISATVGAVYDRAYFVDSRKNARS